MKQLPKFFGITIAVIIFGILNDLTIIDIISWTVLISAIAIPTAWLLSTFISVKVEVSEDDRD